MALELINWVFHDLFKVRKQAFQYTLILTAAVDPSTAAIITAKTGYRIRITDVWFVVSTDAAQTLTIRDDAVAPVVLCIVPASYGLGTFHGEFGHAGIAATVSTNVDLVASAAGYAGTLVIEGFYEAIGPFTPATV